jgi:hypothetical protein
LERPSIDRQSGGFVGIDIIIELEILCHILDNVTGHCPAIVQVRRDKCVVADDIN